VGADIARKKFCVWDREVLSAVAKHSLGSVRMTPFEKLIYVADLLAPDRDFEGVFALRRLAFRNLDRAFFEGVRVKMLYLLKSGQPVHPECLRVWNHSVCGKA
jgi:predicted HD superfamily hydrolase involved in NAD metabolism